MKIAQIMAGSPQGGAELFFERLSLALHQNGHEILAIIRRDARRAARLRAGGLTPIECSFGGALDFWTRPQIRRHLKKFAPQITIAWMGRAARHTPQGDWVLVGRLGGHYDLKRFAHADHLVGNTQGVLDWCQENGFPQNRLHLLPNFVPDAANAPPAKLPIPENAKSVLAMGRLHPNKGFDVLIAAITRLPNIHAIIAGEGPERAALETLARDAQVADRIHFLGWRTDTAALLAAADLLVCPSRIEPLGNVILEAFSANTPVVAAAADGPRMLIESGRTGILVPLESGVALAAGIDSILQNPQHAKSMAQAGRIKFEAEFSEHAVLAKWQNFLTKIEKTPCAA